METCCTCARILSDTPPYTLDKATPEDRRVPCCGRVICGLCIQRNSRFAEYCPFCQISTTPSSLPQRLRDPPLYSSAPSTSTLTAKTSSVPPPYVARDRAKGSTTDVEKAALNESEKPAEDTLHFLDHRHDSIASLSLRYGVPAAALRRANNVNSDHLLLGRKTVIIPGEFYKAGVSLSPQPVEGEEEELRKAKIRRLMTSCKIADYDIAVLYLEQHGYDLNLASEAFVADEEWERTHPPDKSRPKNSNRNIKTQRVFRRS